MLLLLPLLLSSAVPAFALKQKSAQETVVEQELKQELVKLASAAGVLPQEPLSAVRPDPEQSRRIEGRIPSPTAGAEEQEIVEELTRWAGRVKESPGVALFSPSSVEKSARELKILGFLLGLQKNREVFSNLFRHFRLITTDPELTQLFPESVLPSMEDALATLRKRLDVEYNYENYSEGYSVRGWILTGPSAKDFSPTHRLACILFSLANVTWKFGEGELSPWKDASRLAEKIIRFASNDAAGAEQLTLGQMKQRLLNLPPGVESVQLPAPYNTTVTRVDLLDNEGVLAEIAQYANVDRLSLGIVETHTVRVEPPPADPGRPRWTWGIVQLVEQYEEIVGETKFQEALGEFPKTDGVREAMAARPVSAGRWALALRELKDGVDVKFDQLRKDKGPNSFDPSLRGQIGEILATAVLAVPTPLENAQRASLDLVQAAVDYNVPLRVFGSDGAARSGSGTPKTLLEVRKVLQESSNIVLRELDNGNLFLHVQHPMELEDFLEPAALRLDRRLEELLAGRPQALDSPTGLSLAGLLETLREVGNWESLEIYHQDNPTARLAAITVTQLDAEEEFSRGFEQAVPLLKDRENLTYDLSIFGLFGNRLYGKIVLRPRETAAGTEQAGIENLLVVLLAPRIQHPTLTAHISDWGVEREHEQLKAPGSPLLGSTVFATVATSFQDAHSLLKERVFDSILIVSTEESQLSVLGGFLGGTNLPAGLVSSPISSPVTAAQIQELQNGNRLALVAAGDLLKDTVLGSLTNTVLTSLDRAVVARRSAAGVEAETLATMVNAVNLLVEESHGLAAAHRPNPGETQYLLSTLSRLDGKGSWAISILVHYVEESRHPFRVAVVRHRPSTGGPLEIERTIANRGTNRRGSVLTVFHHVLSFAEVQQAVRELAGEPTAAGTESADQRVNGLMEMILRRAGQGELDTVAVLNVRGNVAGTFPVERTAAGEVSIAQEVERDLRAALLKLVQSSAGGNVSVQVDTAERELQFRPIGGSAASAASGAAPQAGLEAGRRGTAVTPVLPPTGDRISLPFEPAARRFAAPASAARQPAAGLARGDARPESGLKNAPTSLYKLIFRPENAGLALLLPEEGVQARIIVGSWEQRRILLEIRSDLEGAILPLEEFDSVESAVEFARSDSQLGSDATEVQMVLSQRSRPLLLWQIETWLRPFPWKPLTLKEALLDNVMNILGLQV